MMSRLVTGLFYERSEAERAVEALRSEGVPSESIYLEGELPLTTEVGRKGGAVSRTEQERRIAGLESGIIIGLTVGVLAGVGFGFLGSSLSEWIARVEPSNSALTLPLAFTSPVWGGVIGALFGILTGGLIGCVVDYTLSRLGAGPPLPAEETLVTVSTEEGKLDQVYAALFRSRARHLHVAERAA
jgi:hypothetical protein